MTIARRFLRDRRRGLAGWTAGVLASVLFSVALYPSIKGEASFNDFIDKLPQAMRESLGLSSSVSFTSAPGYLQSRLFASFLPILFLVYAIGLGARALGTAEEDGTLELLLSNPVSRRRVLRERYAAVVALVAGLGVVATVASLGLAPLFGALDGVDVAGFLVAAVAVVALALLHGTVAFAAGAVWGRRGSALSAGAGVAVGGYVLQVLASALPSGPLHALRWLSPWEWYLSRNMLAEGPGWWAVLAPAALSAVLVVACAAVFEGRDLR